MYSIQRYGVRYGIQNYKTGNDFDFIKSKIIHAQYSDITALYALFSIPETDMTDKFAKVIVLTINMTLT